MACEKRSTGLPIPTGPKPKVGKEIYVPTQLYLDRDDDDVNGGLATIAWVGIFEMGRGRTVWEVHVKEVPKKGYFYENLLPEQDRLRKEFGKRRASR